MHSELFRLPFLNTSVKMYGVCLMVGFLSAVWLAMRRAARVKADPDRVLDLSFLALLFGVGGARLFYVAHYWQTQFADADNKFLAIIDIRMGGLEFLGGLLGAMLAIVIYLVRTKQSARLYLDVLAPGAMWGLAFGRLGCFFNGCCFGGLCVVPGTVEPASPLAVQFPYHSPAQLLEWEDRLVTVPAELITTGRRFARFQPRLVPQDQLYMSVERREGPRSRLQDSREAYENALAAGENGEKAMQQKAEMERAEQAFEEHQKQLVQLRVAQKYPSRVEPSRDTSVSELEDLAAYAHSLPIHPAQLYAAAHAMLLSAFLSALFYRRKRHGVVLGGLLLLYPLARVPLEMIRVDNPADTAGLTVSQFVSLGMFITGAAYLYVIYKYLPERSRYADDARPKEEEGGKD